VKRMKGLEPSTPLHVAVAGNKKAAEALAQTITDTPEGAFGREAGSLVLCHGG
jgi:hypothetical protein